MRFGKGADVSAIQFRKARKVVPAEARPIAEQDLNDTHEGQRVCTVTTSWGQTLHGSLGDMLVNTPGRPEDTWVVAKDIFAQTYRPLEGRPGLFFKPALTDVAQMAAPFEVESKEGWESGSAGDFLARGPKGELYIIPAGSFAQNYEWAS